MKLIESEEKRAHIDYITAEGTKGLFCGTAISAGLFLFLKTRHAAAFARYNATLKTCILTVPTISVCAYFADQGLWEFDRRLHSSDVSELRVIEEFREWRRLSWGQKTVNAISNNKYPIILSTWVASMYGSWVYVNRDKVMTTAQKAVQARMYAQALTIVLLLGSIVLAAREQELNKSKPPPIPEWKEILLRNEQKEKPLITTPQETK